jgi:hypothetical protein
MADRLPACRLVLAGLAVLLIGTPGVRAQSRTPISWPGTVRWGGPYPLIARPYVGAYHGYGWAPGIFPGYHDPFFWGAGYGWGYGNSIGGALQGAASLIQAQGQYHQDIQQARQARLQNQATAIDNERKKIEFEMWYETVRPTAPRLMKQTEATDLDWARNHAQNTEIWSGRTLNVLLRSILKAPDPTGGPQVPLDENQLRGLNLTDGTSHANLSMARDEGKIDWPEALAAGPFDEVRDQFSKTFAAATRQAQSGEMPSRAMMNSLRGDLQKLEEKLADQVGELAPSRFIESRRLLNRLRDNLRGMSDPRLVRSSQSNWRKDVQSVSDLVGHMMKNGLQFGPAMRGDEPSYTATYFALRRYEMALMQYQLRSEGQPREPAGQGN